MDLGDLLRCLNGVSTPFGGVSWVPPADERPVAQAVLAMLEDRRVLYRPYEMEDRHHSLASVGRIRKALTESLGQVSQESPSDVSARHACGVSPLYGRDGGQSASPTVAF